MPEGDTILRTAAVLRRVLVGGVVTAARATAGSHLRRPPILTPLVGATVSGVEARGKHVLISFAADTPMGTPRHLTLHTHMRMTGSWQRYAPGEPWKASPRRASVVLETESVVAVCFDCPVAELLTDADLARSRPMTSLGPDLLSPSWDADHADEALRRLRRLRTTPIGEALLDQRAVAGMGNVVRNEVLFMEQIDPWQTVGSLDDATLHRLLAAGRKVLSAGAATGRRVTTGVDRPGAHLWVYRRAGRPCRHCGSLIRASRQGPLARTTYWCPSCQVPEASPAADPAGGIPR